MDGSRFDDLARALAARRTRRGFLAGALAALAGIRVTEAACRNRLCKDNPAVCGDGCVCCAYSNGNNRCMSASQCESGPGEVLCPPGLVYDQASRTCVTPCDPASCASLGAVCGTHADGCGGTLACGDCPSGQECTPGGCRTANGGGCTAGTECASSVCASGVCCATACDGACQTCASGTCQGTTGGACGGTGVCAGTCQSGACTFPGATTVCADPVCSGPSTATTSACDGAGNCAPATTNCGLYLCVDGECPAGCASDAGCAGDAYCDDTGVCRGDQPNGGPCASPDQCQSGVCAGDVCCATPCDGLCQSCASGTCQGTTGGTCGGTGVCAGTCQSGVCDFPGGATVCADPVCSGPATVMTSVCDGAGTCASTTADCGLFLCASGACLTVCIGDSECAGDAYCDDTGVCRDDQPNGGPCTGPDKCQSGICVGGVCCDAACDGLCQSCASGTCQGTTGGICAGTGVCASVCQDGACVAPGEETVCEGTGPCAATCNEGACVFPGAQTACGESTCLTDLVAEVTVCNGHGGCVTTTAPCGYFRCIDGACLTSCAGDDDCAESAFCDDGGICRRDLLTGEPCDGPNDCRSDFCVDGICCNSVCDGECEACNLPDSVGSCTAVPSGTATKCTGSGICNGACDGTRRDVCTYPGNETTCRSEVCRDNALEPRATCNGAGDCDLDGPRAACDPYICAADMLSCRETCDGDDHCAPGFNCSESGQCGNFAENGTSCDAHEECRSGSCINFRCRGTTLLSGPCDIPDDCASGFCVGGHCCHEACTGWCRSCATGACLGVVEGSCGPNDGECRGTCDNTATCIYPPEDTVCGPTGCVGGVQYIRATCSAGACLVSEVEYCAPFVCDADGIACLEACTLDEECIDGLVCVEDTCREVRPFGGVCIEDKQCESNNCVEGACGCPLDGDGAPCAEDRVCCNGVCCAEGGECQNGACTVSCLPLGTDCTSSGQCCLDGEAICHSDVHAADRTRWPSHVEWPGYAYNPDSRTCCRPFGASCTTHEDCCTSQHEIGGGNEAEFPVLCSPDGICGGPGAACLTFAGNFDLACETSVCCESVNIVTGHARECCAADAVCDPYGFGGCNYDAPLGAPCTVDRDCSTGHCREGICCDPCGGQCGKPMPDMTPCWDWDRLDGANHCCGGACVSVRTDINCGTCGHTCPAGLDYCEPNEYPFICACSDPGNTDGVCQNETGHCRSTVLGNVCVMDEVTESVPARTTCAAACETDADCADFYGLFIEYMFPNESPNPAREVCRPYFRPNNPFAEICTQKATCSTDPNYCFGRCVPIYEDGPPQI